MWHSLDLVGKTSSSRTICLQLDLLIIIIIIIIIITTTMIINYVPHKLVF